MVKVSRSNEEANARRTRDLIVLVIGAVIGVALSSVFQGSDVYTTTCLPSPTTTQSSPVVAPKSSSSSSKSVPANLPPGFGPIYSCT